ncbi:MAG: tetratricopeptide repeat protein, partial [Planctomycetes bacterium]|nr:tetratricopeptide repeat protein [Planctomycetota bacterium]
MKVAFRKIAVVGLLFVFGCRMPSIQQFFANPTQDTPDATSLVSGRAGETDLQGKNRHRDNDSRPLWSRIFGSGKAADNGSVADNLRRAHVATRQKRWTEAKRLFHVVLKRQPKNVVAHHELAKIADEKGDYRTAESHYIAALHESPRDPNLYNDLGYSYFLQERYSESEKLLNRALQFDSHHARALNNLGWLYGTRGDYQTAYKFFLRAGTESQARELISRLFPAGRPGAGTQNVSHWANSENQGRLHAPRPGGEHSQRLQPNGPSFADDERPELNREMEQLRQQMARAHQQGVLERLRRKRERQSGSANDRWNPNAGRRADDTFQQADRGGSTSQHTSSYQHNGSRTPQDHRMNGTRNRPQFQRRDGAIVPAHRLKDVLEEIDRTSGRRNQRQDGNEGKSGSRYRETQSRGDYTDFPRVRTLDGRQPSYFRGAQQTYRTENSSRTTNPESTQPWPREQGRSSVEPEIFRDRFSRIERTDDRIRSAYQSSGSDNRRFKTYPSRSLPSVNREALKLGHNAGAGGNVFPLISQQSVRKSAAGNYRESNESRRLASSRNEAADLSHRFASPERDFGSRNPAPRNDRAVFPLSGRDRMAADRRFSSEMRAEKTGSRNGNSLRSESRDRYFDRYGRKSGFGMQTERPAAREFNSTRQPSSWDPHRTQS